ncbi:unnamed protein product [Brachionus calyciflorus]|uniref:RING-type domain-containing protein n=1 Tax=Brachionus calyciflorus TaxID=104777 RepID=A0A813S2Y2_9BILA|nr:unnamed protein product [Brachionus calyciflorus]
MSNRHKPDEPQNESLGFKIFKAVEFVAAIGLGAYIGYQLYKELTAEEVEKLPITIATNDDKNLECAICLDSFRLNDKLRVLPCQHKYHADCIMQWVTRNPNCPQCRRDC